MATEAPSKTKEQRILQAMRKALGSIVRDTTPEPGMRHPLSEKTIEDIKICFSLIATRERELLEEAGKENHARPRFTDEPRNSEVIRFMPAKNNKDVE